jgi:hypothetical protein
MTKIDEKMVHVEPTQTERVIAAELIAQGFAHDDAWASTFGISEALATAQQGHPELVKLAAELIAAVKPLDDLPPSIQSMQNIRIIDAANKAAAALNATGIALKEVERERDELQWLADNVGLELSWGELGDDLSEAGWRVYRQRGGINDREWDLVAIGSTPSEALHEARKALAESNR